MTSTPVGNIGNLLNNVTGKGSSASNRLDNLANSFGTVMNQASGNRNSIELPVSTKGDLQATTTKQNDQTSVDNSREPDWKKDVQSSNTGKAEQVKQTNPKKAEDAVTEAGDKLVEAVADQFHLSEEEVQAAMENLGLTAISLLDAQNMTNLALYLSGNPDSLTLLTDEGLYQNVQELLQTVTTLKNGLMSELGINENQLSELLAQANLIEEPVTDEMMTVSPDKEENELIHPDNNSVQNQNPEDMKQYTITVSENGKTVELQVQTDEKGNAEATQSIGAEDRTEEIQVSGEKSSGKQGEENQKGSAENHANTLLESLLQNRTQAINTATDTAPVFQTTDTQEIMDQILDYMKIQLKPDMDQLEMQLHPASLGTLHIQIASKGGVITAQFAAESEAVKAAIEGQLTDLKETLKDQGIKVDAVEVTVESHSFESNLWQGDDSGQNAYEEKKKGTRRINLNDLTLDDELELDEEEKLVGEMMAANGNTVDYTA